MQSSSSVESRGISLMLFWHTYSAYPSNSHQQQKNLKVEVSLWAWIGYGRHSNLWLFLWFSLVVEWYTWVCMRLLAGRSLHGRAAFHAFVLSIGGKEVWHSAWIVVPVFVAEKDNFSSSTESLYGSLKCLSNVQWRCSANVSGHDDLPRWARNSEFSCPSWPCFSPPINSRNPSTRMFASVGTLSLFRI